MIPSALSGIGPGDLEKIKAIARKAYPRVPQLSTDALAGWMQTARPILISNFQLPQIETRCGSQTRGPERASVRRSQPARSSDSEITFGNHSSPALFLVDVRSQPEFAVSHLRDAVNLQTPGQIAAAVNEREPARTVLYCSVGFRSSRLAHLLAERGLRDVMNLEGSIFQWANEGRAVYRGDVPVQQVHPYGKRWAGLLNAGLASEC